MIMINCPTSEYISTLKREYYTSRAGKRVLTLINKYNPDIYLELHCYGKENFNKLIDTERRYKDGVPPLIELENKVLIGSISPLIRITFFEKYDFSFMLEMPCNPSTDSMGTYLDVLNMVIGSKNRFEILKKLEHKYPSAVKKASEYFFEFSDNFVRLFKEIQRELMKDNDLRNFQTNRDAIMKKASQMNISITSKQAELILQAFLLYKEYNSDFIPDNSWASVG